LQKDPPDWTRIRIALNAEAKLYGKEFVVQPRNPPVVHIGG
jgi:hypothetical protein